MTTAFKCLRNHYMAITALSGVVLITMGLLLFTGELAQLNIKAQEAPRLPGHQHLQVDLTPGQRQPRRHRPPGMPAHHRCHFVRTPGLARDDHVTSVTFSV